MTTAQSMSAVLSAVMKDVGLAIDYDRRDLNEDAYRKYLECVLRVSTSLIKSVHANEGHVYMTPEITKMVKLGQQCMDRVGNIVQNKFPQPVPSTKTTMHLPLSSSTSPQQRDRSYCSPVTPLGRKTTPVSTTPQGIVSPEQSQIVQPQQGDQKGIGGAQRKPGDLRLSMKSYGSLSTRKMSPMEMASRQNQQLLSAFRRRQAIAKNKSASFTLSLTLQRKMAENLAIAQAQEEALAKKMQERQARLEEQAAKRFHTPVGLSEEEQQQRHVYRKVLEFEQEQSWMVELRTKFENNPTDLEVISQLITAVLRCDDHPLTELLKKYQNKLLDKLTHIVWGKEHDIEDVKVPLNEALYADLKPFQITNVKTNQFESSLTTDQSKSCLQTVDENESAESCDSLTQSGEHYPKDNDSDQGSDSKSQVSISDECVTVKSDYKKQSHKTTFKEKDFTQVTLEIKDDIELAIGKGDSLKTKLETENKKLKTLSRQISKDYELYNQENMDDLFESSEEDDTEELATDRPVDDTEENRELNEIVEETGNVNLGQDKAELDDNNSAPTNDTSHQTDLDRETSDSVAGAEAKIDTCNNAPKLKKNPSFENLETKIKELRNEAYHRHLKGITEDILTSIERVQVLFVIVFEQLDNAEGRDQCNVLLEDFFFRPLWNHLLTLFRLSNKPKEISLANMMTKHQDCDPQRFQVRAELCLQPSAEADTTGYPYQTAVDELKAIALCSTMMEKLDYLVKASKQVMYCVDQYYKNIGSQAPGIGADDLLPVLCYIVIRSGLPQLVSECHAVERFIHEGYMFGEEGYCLTSFQTAINYLISEGLQ